MLKKAQKLANNNATKLITHHAEGLVNPKVRAKNFGY
jgi:hypothetical protein